MKNSELIEKLQKLPPNANVVLNTVSFDTHQEWFDPISAYVEKDQNTVIIEIA